MNNLYLSPSQQKAVETFGKDICVSAGAGSGKTRVLVERFLYLVEHHQLSPASILAITFTEKAANEMKRRIVAGLREAHLEEARREVENAAIGTIHSFCARILREHPVEAGVDPHFAILEAEEAGLLQERTLDQVLESAAAEPGAFDLMKIYGEKFVRQGILSAFRKSRNFEASFETILRRETALDRKKTERQLEEALGKIEGVPGAADFKQRLERCRDQNEFSFREINDLRALRGTLRAAGKQKEAIGEFKELFDDWISLLFQTKSAGFRDGFIRLALRFEAEYEKAKQEEGLLDFDDLQIRAVRLLGSSDGVSAALRKIYQARYREIMVDEFQDTNPLQDRLIELVRTEGNLFIVGDFKQSIYGFRGTQVELFLGREKTFAASPRGERISLAENFRSRPSLIGFINRFFERLWQEDRIPFERLEAARDEAKSEVPVEWLGLEKSKDENVDQIRMREARVLAEKIRDLADREGVGYGEIACLFEAMSKNVHFYEQEFRRAGIPYYIVSSRGFYSQIEIQDVLSFLSALENPKRDIPLAASLRSPLFQISDETLFWLARHAKKEKKDKPLASALEGLASLGEIGEKEKGKIRFFQEAFDHFLAVKEKLRVSELVEQVIRRTDYDLYVLKLRQGERRLANLKKLVEIAREVESKESLHLGDFIRLIRGLETREVRESQAQIEAEEGNVVRMMSIHMAKGLEFPVVILPDLGRGEKSESERFLLTQEGLGLAVRNEETLLMEETFALRKNKKHIAQSRSEESKRILYVAMTRARERLILAGPKESSDAETFHDMANWAQWVSCILGEGDWPVKILKEGTSAKPPFDLRRPLAERKIIRRHLENLMPVPLKGASPEVERIFEGLSRPERAYFQRIDLPVSAFVLFAKDPEEYFRVYEIGAPGRGIPAAAVELKNEDTEPEENLSSADFGTRVHQVLEQIWKRRSGKREIGGILRHFTQDLEESVRREIKQMVEQFLESPQGKELGASQEVYPELSFSIRLPHGLIHGTLDLLYRNQKGDWIIADYKTSAVDADETAAQGELYRVQMELYGLAAKQILSGSPAEARVLFLRTGEPHRFVFQEGDFRKFFLQYTQLQKAVLEFRKDRIRPEPLLS